MFLTLLDHGKELATADTATPCVDAAVLHAVRVGKGSRVIEQWVADGRQGFNGAIEKTRYIVEDDGGVYRIDGSGVPATVAASAALWIDGAYRTRTGEWTDRHSKGV